jgi:hypothetical protein
MQSSSSVPSQVSGDGLDYSSERFKAQQQNGEPGGKQDALLNSLLVRPDSTQLSEGQSPSPDSSSHKYLFVPDIPRYKYQQSTSHPNEQKQQQPKPDPLLFARMTARKRPADLANLDGVDGNPSEGLPDSLSGFNHGETIPPSQICLCQKDPKIPRPRNGKASSLLYASLKLTL